MEQLQDLFNLKIPLLRSMKSGARGAPSVERPILDFGSGHDLSVREIEPLVGQYGPVWDFVSPSLSAFPCVCSLLL